ncbi:MAG: SPOR domain-containing protein, partial [Sandarakinorhabdus sp.]|nr:SPOR domain-containing protein [Sandarakinorhabdus sp.]
TAVGKAKPIYEPGASIIKLQMGPYKTKDLAKDACAKIAFSGRACFVIEG